MATRSEALEDLRIAKMILDIALKNHYSKVVIYLQHNVQKAQSALDAFDKPSMLEGIFNILAPRSPKEPLLPFTMDQCTTPTFRGVVVNYSEPHYV
jgi:hypothetical protein